MRSLLLSFIWGILFLVSTLTAQVQRNPVFEGCTGTWCQWCPCGHTIIENILASIPNAIIIEYHGPTGYGDPFAGFPGYQVMSSLTFSSYPTGIVDRTSAPQSRSSWAGLMNNRNNIPAPVDITIHKNYNSTTRVLNAVIHSKALTNLTGSYKISIIIVENGLVYGQTGNTSCPGGSSYVHDHVARAMLNGVTGDTLNGSIPWTTGRTINKSFQYTVPSQFNAANCEIVAFVYKVEAQLYLSQIQQGAKWPLTGSTTFPLTVNVNSGWNLVAAPGQHPVNQNVNTWWAYRDQGANVFKYGNGYIPVSETVPGEGYWMKHPEPNIYNTGDEWPSGGIIYNPHVVINGEPGWNLIGIYDDPVQVSELTTTPPGIQAGQIFGYFNGMYQAVTELQPGYGYWIKLSQGGIINIP